MWLSKHGISEWGGHQWVRSDKEMGVQLQSREYLSVVCTEVLLEQMTPPREDNSDDTGGRCVLIGWQQVR
jgi:hypothetical protein